MSITDELREYAERYECNSYCLLLTNIADRIDERVKNIRFNEHQKGYQDGIRDRHWYYDPEHTECMVSEEHGYIKLPVDADGEPVHIGDVMDNTHKRGFAAKTVIGISYHEGGRMCVRVDEDELRWHDPLKLRHHHETTVEDVLREFAERWDDPAHYAKGELVEAYAEKLREVVEHERI